MSTLEETFTSIAKNFIAGDFDAVAAQFDTPIAIYAGERVVICPSHARFIETMRRYHALLTDAGITDVSVNVIALPMMRGTTGTVWVEKTYYDAKGARVDSCQVRYFFRRIYGQTLVCMLEYVTRPAAVEDAEFGYFSAA